MFEVPNKFDWCWFCDLTCQFVYDEVRGNWCCTRCGRDLAHWSPTIGNDEPWEKTYGPKDNGVLKSYQRKHPRFVVELPLDYSRTDHEERYGGVATNASEGGLLVYLHELIPKGTILKIVILYVTGSKHNTIGGTARIVWGDLSAKIDRGKYRYGLKFESFSSESFRTFNSLLDEAAKAQAR